ncbi:glycogen/starch synthase [Shewanella sp. 10N.286.52.C2]|uniref:glycogen synthase n=1 Tax=Shewanella sp. 10N.286.52.C2 TaxID=1880838 RepID=UPI001F5383FE|nr:glycogen/starch synthase [Shewanella sp. 10N.286.52.C2]
MKKVLMIAAENDAISGAKVGGMADVIRDLPPALASEDIIVDVAMPNYGYIAQTYNANNIGTVAVKFGANIEIVSVALMPRPRTSVDGNTNLNSQVYLFEHHLFNSEGNQVYCAGSNDRPFADDATKFALFNLAVAQAYIDGLIPEVDVMHMHDWHAGMLVMLRAFDPQYAMLKQCQCVFSIHNLALQGIRPIRDDVSSFAAWFPELTHLLTDEQKAHLSDPRYPNCVNPMKMGIELSDKVHLVSPTYAHEVLMASDHQNGFFGGEGLEASMLDKHNRGDIVGILNGCVYENDDSGVNDSGVNNSDVNSAESELTTAKPDKKTANKSINQLLVKSQDAVIKWLGKTDSARSVDQITLARLQQWQMQQINQASSIDFLMTSVGRLTDQKVLLLRQPYPVEANSTGQSLLDAMLIELKRLKPQGVFMLLGSGDHVIAKEFQQVASRHSNFVFINGYDQQLSDELYQLGDLFVMPSSFEPCGISQLLAMKQGQVCIAHGVGGLRDTIKDQQTGWLFEGHNLAHQAEQFIQVLINALSLSNEQPEQYRQMEINASQERFSWQQVAKQYRQQLYS